MTSLFGWCPVLCSSVNGANSDLYVCESLMSCGGGWEKGGGGGGETLLEMIKFSLTLGSRASQSLATIQCQNLGKRTELGLVTYKCDF